MTPSCRHNQRSSILASPKTGLDLARWHLHYETVKIVAGLPKLEI